MRKFNRWLSFLLVAIMTVASFASCVGDIGNQETQETTEESASDSAETTDESESENEEGPKYLGTNEELINNAQNLAGKVNSYFDNADRNHFVMENGNAVLKYSLGAENFQGFAVFIPASTLSDDKYICPAEPQDHSK